MASRIAFLVFWLVSGSVSLAPAADDTLLLGAPAYELSEQDRAEIEERVAATDGIVEAYLASSNDDDHTRLRRELKAALAKTDDAIAAQDGPISRQLASFMVGTMRQLRLANEGDIAIERGRRAVAIERQLNANAFFFSEKSPWAVSTHVVETFLDNGFEAFVFAAETGDDARADRLRHIAFETAQSAFVTRGPRGAVRALRVDPGLPQATRESGNLVHGGTDLTEALNQQKAMIAGGAFDGASKELREAIDKDVEDMDAVLQQLIGRLHDDGIDVAAQLLPSVVAFTDAAASLRADEALLLTTPGRHYFHSFLATSEGLTWNVSQDHRSKINSDVRLFRKATGAVNVRGAKSLTPASDTDTILMLKSARSLYLTFIQPFETGLVGKRKLLIAATGAATAFPFEALIAGELSPGQTLSSVDWLIRRYSVTMVPAVEIVARPRQQTALADGEQTYLAFGDPDYTADLGSASPDETGLTKRIAKLARLPDSGDEVRLIASSLPAGRSKVLTGKDANELKLVELSVEGELARYDVVHFATHGMNPGFGNGVRRPMLAMAPALWGATYDYRVISHFLMFPDGELTIDEITALRFGAALVILSACETGGGNGADLEGFSGLASGFLAAGARTVMGSHWPVESRAAVEIVTETMARLFGGAEMGEARRLALVALVTKGGDRAHPRYWAPFVLYGAP